ncbi:MAG: adenylosuccinate lyase [Deltaproteobacteria bacterium]|nr:adenylosuccinate lyase [Deltaproteobacteria bacterium]
MLARYSRPEMSRIWSDENRFKIWLEIETLALEKMSEQGSVPREAYLALKEKGSFNVERVLEIEERVKHDVIAFLTNVAESVGPLSRYVHRGMTSSDLLDTALAVQFKQAGALILEGIETTLGLLKERALQYKYTACIGRSHGIHAEPITFGLKLIGWYAELKRQGARVEAALEGVKVGKLAGAVGTYASVSPQVEAHVMTRLGLKPESVPTQIVQRDRHACFFSALAQLGASIERFCVEIRHLQRTEVHEVEEEFSKGQKGSSAMPHKRNPILSENLCGLARLLRGYALSAFENVALWHERDISHSSVERIIGPDACILVDFMLARFAKLVRGLVVYEDRMKENLELTRGIIFSGTVLVELTDRGMLREDAYTVVQKHALAALQGGLGLKDRLLADKEVTAVMPPAEIEGVFDVSRHFKQVDLIFDRTLIAA